VDSIKDLGILFDTRLNFKDHIQEKINKAYNMIGLLKRNFIHVDCYTFILRGAVWLIRILATRRIIKQSM